MAAVDTVTCQTIELEALVIDEAIQPREEIDECVVDEYTEIFADAIDGESPFPPLDVFFITDHFVIADGFHRFAAAKKANFQMLECRVHHGSARDAMLFAAQANARHGLPYTPGDKHRIILRALADAELGELTNRSLARKFAMSHTYVNKVRKEFDTARRFDEEFASSLETVSTSTHERPPGDPTREQEALAHFLGVDPEDCSSYRTDDAVAALKTSIVGKVVNGKMNYDDAKASVAERLPTSSPGVVSFDPLSAPTVPVVVTAVPKPQKPVPPHVRLCAARATGALLGLSEDLSGHTSPESVLKELRTRTLPLGVLSSQGSDSVHGFYERAADSFISPLKLLLGECAEGVTAGDLEQAVDEWKKMMQAELQAICDSYHSSIHEIREVRSGQLLLALHSELETQRYKESAETAREFGKVIQVLAEYAKTEHDEHKFLRRVVNM